jgi:hypothetical protein
MKTFSFLIIAMIFSLQSCGQKQAVPAARSGKSQIVLGAFNDMTTLSSYNEESLGEFPRIVDFSQKMTPVKNQGHRGTCTFFAATALLEAAIKIDKGIEVNLSEEYSIYSTKYQGHYDDVEASHISVNLQAAKKGGILLEKNFSYRPSWFEAGRPCAEVPDQDNTSMECYVHTPPVSALEKIIPGDSIKTGFIRKNTNEIIKYLATNGRPLSISLPVNFSGWDDNGSVTYTENMRQECLSGYSKCGAHSVILTGYNLDEHVFYFKNSWGNDWGKNGFGTLTFEMVDRYVDGYLYYAKIDGDLNIPEDANVDNLKIESLLINPTLTDSDMSLEVKIQATQTDGRYIAIRSVLGYTTVEDSEETQSRISPLYYENGTIQTMGSYENLGPQQTGLSMPKNILYNNYIQEVFANPSLYKLALESTVFIYTDMSVAPTPLFTVNQSLTK